ncbi:MAG: hypothetical protein Q4C58_08235 [Eubacteriales bacterium]|nr:hypothetical protein [Eubacteriales bacterium]
MIFNVIGLAIGVLISGAGIYYLHKEKGDKESRKIYGITAGIGAVITIFIIVKMLLELL